MVTIKHLGDWNQGCTVVRIGSLATACVENRIQLQVTESGAPKLFLNYKGAGVNNRDIGPADIINMPDGYSNVAHKCDSPDMVCVIYHGNDVDGPKAYGSVDVVANDPRCKK